MPVVTPAASLDQLAADTAALAEAVSLAIRIEPQLLRKMRLALFPNFDAGTEADLWFSSMVETRTSSGIVLHPTAREALRQQLGTKPEALETAWTVVESLHREISPALFAEEKLAYLTLAGKQEAARELLRSVVATLVSPRGRGLAGWAAQAVDRLPQAARPMEEAQMLTLGASLRLGAEAPRDSGISAAQASEWAAWLSPDDLEMAPFGVALLEDAVEFGPVGRPSSHRILFPKTTPVVVELGWSDGISRRTERTALKPDGVTLVELGPAVTEVDLKTVLGDSYTLTVPARRERGSTQKKIERIRAPRVQITYDVEVGGAIELKELPFVVAVLADLGGTKPLEALSLRGRKLIDIDFDSRDAVMQALKPRTTVLVSDPRTGRQNFSVEFEFQSLDDFLPGSLVRQIEPARERLEKRTLLASLLSLIEGDQALSNEMDGYLQESSPASASKGTDASIVSSLNDIFMKTLLERHALSLEESVTYGTALLETLRDSGSLRSVEAAISTSIAAVDKELSDWINPVLHDRAFQALEATWRGLHYLVAQTESGEKLKIRVLDVSRPELALDLARASEFDQSEVFQKLYHEYYGVFGGSPIGLIVGAYEFDRSSDDVALLERMGAVAAWSHAPFVAAAGPAMFKLESFEQLGDPRDLSKIFDSADAADWKQLRESENASYLALALPHMLLRLPYGRETRPIEEFNFEEKVYRPEHAKLLWGNAAFALAARITNAFARSAWPAGIRGVEGGGLVEGLPAYTFTTQDGDLALKCPTEISITDSREKELSDQGFIPLIHFKGTGNAAFVSVNSIQKPAMDMYESSDRTYAARLSSRLPYRLAASRFAHYLKVMMRDKIGSFMSPKEAELFLNRWISNYVQKEPNLSVTEKAKFPLQSAHVEVREVEGIPNALRATLFIRPDFLLEDSLPADMQLIVDLPAPYGSSIAL